MFPLLRICHLILTIHLKCVNMDKLHMVNIFLAATFKELLLNIKCHMDGFSGLRLVSIPAGPEPGLRLLTILGLSLGSKR